MKELKRYVLGIEGKKERYETLKSSKCSAGYLFFSQPEAHVGVNFGRNLLLSFWAFISRICEINPTKNVQIKIDLHSLQNVTRRAMKSKHILYSLVISVIILKVSLSGTFLLSSSIRYERQMLENFPCLL